MVRHDVWVIGHVTRDRLAEPAGEERAGGTATYCALALSRLGADVGVLTRLAPADEDELLVEHREAGVQLICAPSAKTTEFENRYSPQSPDRREQQVGAVALPFVPDDLDGIEAQLVHLGPLTADDMSVDFLDAAARTGRVSLDVQGFVRRIVRGRVELEDWPEKRAGLARVKVLKADADEACVLTGERDPERAARRLAGWGPAEVLVTLASQGSVIFADGASHRIPAIETPKPVDPTGCGDTYTAAYLDARLRGEGVVDAARYAAAAAALKLRHVGSFDGTPAAVAQLVSEGFRAL